MIVSKIDTSKEDDESINETREFIHKTLREVGMIEEGFEEATETLNEEEEIIMEPGSRETLAVFEQFEIKLGEKIIRLIINLN